MNSVNLIGRWTRDIEIRYSQNEDNTAVARGSLAVDNPFNEQGADFFNLVAFGKTAEFIEKYASDQGTRIGITGRLQSGSYTNKDGQKVYTTDVVISNVYFADSKKEQEQEKPKSNYKSNSKSKYAKK